MTTTPQRYATVHEQTWFTWRHTYRQLLFGIGRRPTHRAIYHVDDEKVQVVAVRHLSQQDLTIDDLD